MTVVAHLSDTHFGTERPEVVEALVDWTHAQRPSLLVVSGDVTQRARRTQFDAARAFVDRLGVPRAIVVPGNHDVPLMNLAARAWRPYSGFARAFGSDLEPEHASDMLCVLAVRTTRRWRHVHGQVSDAQVERVAARLARAPDAQLRVVVTHQPAWTIRAQDHRDRLRGGPQAIRSWARAGADLVLGGHIHLPYVAPLHEAIDGLARRMWIAQAGTAVSHRVRNEAPNSVNLIRVAPGARAPACTVERWDCAAPGRAFERVATHALDLDR